MNIFDRIKEAINARHWAHKGELMTHLTYLSATFVEAHGIHAIAAGVLAVFVLIGLAVQHVSE